MSAHNDRHEIPGMLLTVALSNHDDISQSLLNVIKYVHKTNKDKCEFEILQKANNDRNKTTVILKMSS